MFIEIYKTISNIKNTLHTFQTTSGKEQTVKNTLKGQ